MGYRNLTLSIQMRNIIKSGEYSLAAEPPVRCGESHVSGLTGATLLY